MARHAGFAAVLSFTGEVANDAIGAALGQVPGQPLNVSVPVAGEQILVQGKVWPTAGVSFKQRSDGLVTTEVGIDGQVIISSGLLPTQYVEFGLSATLDVPLDVVIENGQVDAVIDLSQITILGLQLDFSGGPPIVSNPPAAAFQNALSSPQVAAEVTSIIRQLSPVTVTLPLISAGVEKAVSVGPPPPPLQELIPPPNYFVLDFTVSRVVLAQFDGAITIAVDVESGAPGDEADQPITTGNPAGLVDLTTAWSPLIVYWQLDEPQYAQYSSGASMAGPPHRGVNCVALLNPAVISYLLANEVSPGLAAAPLIDQRLRVTGISLDIGWYVPPVPYTPGYGLAVTADVHAYSQDLPDLYGYYYPDPGAVDVKAATVVAYLQEAIFELAQGAESTNTWTLQLVNAAVQVPAWLVITIFFTLVLLAVISPVMLVISMILGLALGVTIEGVFEALTTMLTEAGSATADQLGDALQSLNVPFQQTVNLAGGITADVTTWKLGFSDEGPEAQLTIGAAAANPAAGRANWGATVSFAGLEPVGSDGTSFQLNYDQAFFDVAVTVIPPAANPMINWSLSRPDTGAVVMEQAGYYLDPGVGTLAVDRTESSIQSAGRLALFVQIVGPGGSVSFSYDIQVIDWLDRTHKYVRWVSHTWFRDPGRPKQWRYYWQRTRHSVIHRTDYPGRCRRLNPDDDLLGMWLAIYPGVAAGSLATAPPYEPPSPLASMPYIANLVPEAWQYQDVLPFATAAAAKAGRRGVLCDYCFFGGPTKSQLLVPVP
jgi:hypothetical protein